MKKKCIFAINLQWFIFMDSVYEKLLNQLYTMTTEQLDAEWEELKEYNFGPTMDEYEQIVVQYQTMLAQYPLEDYSMVAPKVDIIANNQYYLAA